MNTTPEPLLRGNFFEVLWAFLRLGCISFGGPVAHLGYYRAAFVERRRWLSDDAYADLVALCQFLPGPASTQTAMGIGLSRAGLPGMAAAWLGFALPSALLMAGFAYGVVALGGAGSAWLAGLKTAVVAVVAQAVWGMARSLAPDLKRGSIAVAAALLMLWIDNALAQVAAIAAGALAGRLLLTEAEGTDGGGLEIRVPHWLSLGALALFAALLALGPLIASALASPAATVADAFFRAGALVFGGGHVVLPLLQQSVVAPGWLGREAFLAGYGAAQAVPGPLFTFSAYLGMRIATELAPWLTAALCLVAIFLPSFLLLLGCLPYWARLRRRSDIRGAMRGTNAAVVGLLLAALYDPVWTSAIKGPESFSIALVAFAALVLWRIPPWGVVGAAAVAGALLL